MQPGYTIQKWTRSWKVLDPAGKLVCLTVYTRGAQEVVRSPPERRRADPTPFEALDSLLDLESVGTSLPLAAMYDGVGLV